MKHPFKRKSVILFRSEYRPSYKRFLKHFWKSWSLNKVRFKSTLWRKKILFKSFCPKRDFYKFQKKFCIIIIKYSWNHSTFLLKIFFPSLTVQSIFASKENNQFYITGVFHLLKVWTRIEKKNTPMSPISRIQNMLKAHQNQRRITFVPFLARTYPRHRNLEAKETRSRDLVLHGRSRWPEKRKNYQLHSIKIQNEPDEVEISQGISLNITTRERARNRLFRRTKLELLHLWSN